MAALLLMVLLPLFFFFFFLGTGVRLGETQGHQLLAGQKGSASASSLTWLQCKARGQSEARHGTGSSYMPVTMVVGERHQSIVTGKLKFKKIQVMQHAAK